MTIRFTTQMNTHPHPSTIATSPRLRFALCLAACGWVASCSPLGTTSRAPVARPQPGPASKGAESAGQGSSPDRLDLTRDVLDAHNAERVRRKLSPLTLNPELTLAAETHAADMARRGKMSHRGGDGSSPFDRMKRAGYHYLAAAENVAYGFDRVEDVMGGWMRSPGHRRNILGPYREIGVGCATAPSGLSYWAVTFGTPEATSFP